MRLRVFAGTGRTGPCRRVAAALSVCLVLVAFPGATVPLSGASEAPLRLLDDESFRRLASVRTDVAELRTRLAGSFEERIRAALEVAGEVPEAVDDIANAARELPLPASMRGPVSALFASVAQAASYVRPLSQAQIQAVARDEEDLRVALRRQVAQDNPRSARSSGSDSLRESIGLRLLQDAYSDVSARAAARAARLIGRALDRHLAALQRIEVGTSRDESVTGCDVIDLSPYLCVASNADNVFVGDEMLLIDFGGNDTYLNSAGGAGTKHGTTDPYVSVNVDLAGNDVYDARDYASGPGDFYGDLSSVQGAGVFGSVGLLVDLGGDDSYVATAPRGERSTIVAQGAATMGGFGGLFDLAGADRYQLSGRPGPERLLGGSTAEYLRGQGSGGLGSVGLLGDEGLGDDVYSMESSVVRQDCYEGCSEEQARALPGGGERYQLGQGAGILGAGLHVDDGGNNAFVSSMTAAGRPPIHVQGVLPSGDEPNYFAGIGPVLLSQVQGAALGGLGVLIAGSGNDRFEANARLEGPTFASVLAQGQGSLGTGVLDDSGGDDTYGASVRAQQTYEVTVDQQCSGCNALAVFTNQRGGANNWLAAQGAGLSGAGLLEDHGGDDAYEVESLYEIELTVEDARGSQTPALVAIARNTKGLGLAVAQGAGDAGTGILIEHAGRNVFRATFGKNTHVTVRGSSETAPAEAESLYRPRAAAQGGSFLGTGGLFELDGDGSVFTAEATVRASTAPDSGQAKSYGFPWPAFHGAGWGWGQPVFFSAARGATVTSSPSQVVCPGSQARGYGAWSECGPYASPVGDPEHAAIDNYGYGRGFVAAPGDAEGGVLGLFAEQAGDGAPIAAAASLRQHDGSPAAGRPLHFDLQRLRRMNVQGNAAGYSWFSSWSQDAITDAGGRAFVSLPGEAGFQGSGDFTDSYRVLVTFDGEPGMWPGHAASYLGDPPDA